ncbi:phage holin family protein [Sulfurirhabdus autotrophica]|uniref:Putative membrane protein YqjE n=1 Tax=Sulfurirhabdus autotrophica TaxID=1706046 RepID=A0A4R3YIV2_9PROT|nr:phage holin family protein [Sulfurirhabdus autotrophica]TCV90613.1 putative membrane protein YqjE [Sulfurirhabdus autotrophica]
MAESTLGLMASLKRLVHTLLAIGQTRLELLSNEWEEERFRISKMFIFGGFTLFFFGLSVLLATVFVVVLFWDTHRLLVIGGFTMLFFGAGFWALNAFRTLSREKPKLFSASLAELSKDRDQLVSRS